MLGFFSPRDKEQEDKENREGECVGMRDRQIELAIERGERFCEVGNIMYILGEKHHHSLLFQVSHITSNPNYEKVKGRISFLIM